MPRIQRKSVGVKSFVLNAKLLNFNGFTSNFFQILGTLPRNFVGKCQDSKSAEKILKFFDSKFDPATGVNPLRRRNENCFSKFAGPFEWGAKIEKICGAPLSGWPKRLLLQVFLKWGFSEGGPFH